MIRNLSNISCIAEKEVLENLEKDLKNYKETVKKEKKFGKILPKNSDHLKKNVYIYLSELAKKKDLSDEALEWMGNFVKECKYSDVQQNLHQQAWVHQYRDMKRME